MSLQAYQKAAQRVESPRQAEYRLFGEVTRALMEASGADPKDFKTRIEALDWNRRVWSVLANDCAQPSNSLPAAMRAQIISLSLWVSRYSSSVMRGQESFDPLIEVNRAMMQGLGGSPAEAA
ncbi:MAG TPA: flagellar biosynthesis regulator FlaF [Caulobacteraceae bacterium]|jgi:flagellar protein FlaF|nr:flagellar biosynthesis regulator FlaF [Caulobacteraceae bacterium]